MHVTTGIIRDVTQVPLVVGLADPQVIPSPVPPCSIFASRSIAVSPPSELPSGGLSRASAVFALELQHV